MTVLITGFDPFGGDLLNSSWEAVKALPDTIEGATIVKKKLPTVFRKDSEVLEEAIKASDPSIVICVGQAGGRPTVTVEKVAINWMEAKLTDNDGYKADGEPILPSGPDAYFTNLPLKQILQAMVEEGIPSGPSFTAGTFVCNDVMYRLMHLVHTKYKEILGGFIHVPGLPIQSLTRPTATPHMAVDMITKSLEIAIKVSLKEKMKNV